MESKELYRCLLGVNEPWTVERVELDMERQRVDVHVGHAKGTRFACPECGRELAVYDHAGERTWRHLDSCQFLTYLHASPPQVSCPEHGVRQAICHGRRRAAASPACSRRWRSRYCRPPTSNVLRSFCASAGIRRGTSWSVRWCADARPRAIHCPRILG